MDLPFTIEAKWQVQQQEVSGENGKVIINSNTCIDIMEDLIFLVVTLYQLYIPVSFRNHLLQVT